MWKFVFIKEMNAKRQSNKGKSGVHQSDDIQNSRATKQKTPTTKIRSFILLPIK
ncbi:hypothetical protein [Niallia sp. FSL W8-0635]|uniref:hypothetical protein n=1 Tax=Niallia sp. FSL W8-0635 TaxID=2975337 RepID=UPI002B03D7B2|nr:hypothetical protein [Yersinia enterocolitica]